MVPSVLPIVVKNAVPISVQKRSVDPEPSQAYQLSYSQIRCVECDAMILDDEFCQECGARVGSMDFSQKTSGSVSGCCIFYDL